jgi:hypothetical protein
MTFEMPRTFLLFAKIEEELRTGFGETVEKKDSAKR